ncbi:Argininosuccinate lyase [hydrothermal vent metagenome]|uniref:Argininosuccinate lyase n=1 Tax=hydrothermal vent metagenome TaxID=652676 RepID=A0A3B0QRI7_9ZZZZ
MKKENNKTKATGATKLWAGRFSVGADKLAEEMNASIGFDWRLFSHDIRGSVAHAKVLRRAKILNAEELKKIVKGLGAVEKDIAEGRITFTSDMEDIHMAVEMALTKKIGSLGGKLHTGRSRNDQVALDIRLYLKEEIDGIAALLVKLRKTLCALAKKNIDVIMPGYTHLQRAQPILFSHHLLAYYQMFKRDTERLLDCKKRVDVMPLGSGALAGSPYDLDRDYAAKLLGFAAVTENSLDAVSDRDFIIEFLSAAATIMMHLSRFGEEIILWSSMEFGFVELSDSFSTGSSIMPQKKNPDLAELARGKTGRVYGALVTMLTVMKALPLAYNKDMQEDKEPLFDTVDTLSQVLGVMPEMLRTMKVNKKQMRGATVAGFLGATDGADYLASRGVPFRKAHHVIGSIVAFCIEQGKTLEDMTLTEWQGFSKVFEEDIKKTVKVESSVAARKVAGGTSGAAVKVQLKKVEAELKKPVQG